jgi:hypothetical protein
MMNRAAAVAPPSSAKDASRSPGAALRPVPSRVHAAPLVDAVPLHGGAPLPPTLRQRMEASFGESFEDVSVHTDASAERLTSRQRAAAVTIGQRIAFGAGRFRPGSAAGDRLIAHELAHVAQQRNGGGVVQAQSLSSQPHEPAELAAEAAADRAVRGERVTSLGPAYSTRHRLMRRALNGLAPPPNPAPLRSLGGPAPARSIRPVVTAPVPPAVAREGVVAWPRLETEAAQVLESPARRLPAEAEQASQEQTEAAREEAQETLAEEGPEVSRAPVTPLAGGRVRETAQPAVREPDSEEAADQRDEAEAAAESEAAGEEVKAEPEAEAEPTAEEKAPARPEDDPGFRRVVQRTRRVARQQAHNNTARRKAAEAQAAALGPPNEVEATAAGNQVGRMAEQEPAAFDKEAFKAALIAKINQIAPNTLEDADEFKRSGKTQQLKGAVVGEVEASKQGAEGPIRQTSEEQPDTSGIQPRPVEPMPPTEPGPPPPSVGAAAAAPKPKSEAEVSLDEGVDQINSRMEEAGVSEEALLNSREPEMIGAVEAKREHEQFASEAPQTYRQDEQSLISNARNQAESSATAGTESMYATRGQQFSSVVGEQEGTRTEDEAKQAELAAQLQQIFQETQSQVRDRLTALDSEVNTIFDSGAETARIHFDNYVEREKEAWKDRRYSGIDGAALWLHDLVLPLPDEVNQIYQQGRDLYIQEMNGVIDQVATAVETGLTEAKGMIDAGRAGVETTIEDARARGVELGDSAVAEIQAQFDTLEEEVQNFEQRTIDSLAQRYVENLQAIDARIEEMQQEDRGLLGRAADAIEGAIRTIEELRQLLLGVLARAASVLETIIADPIGFLGNLIAGIKAGLQAFLGNIVEHLKQGLMGWLFGAVSAAGIQIPESFDLQGILSLAAQILGLTYANIRQRAVRIVGEPVVQALETAAEIFRILMTEGIAGVWNWIKDMLGNLAETVLEGIRNWVIEKVVIAGIAWILSLLNPASALVRAVKAIIDIVMFFINRGSQILSLVNAILDSIAAIASGAIGAMASAVEGALARAIPVAISFLASLLGLGGISSVIRDAIEKIQGPVNRAIDWLIGQAVKLAKTIGRFFGGERNKIDEVDRPARPMEDLNEAQTAAAAAVSARLGEDTSIAEAQSVLPQILRDLQPIGLKNLTIGPGEEDGEYGIFAEASPRRRARRLVRKRITVAISARITVKGEPVLEGITRARGPGRYDFAETLRFLSMGEEREEALGGTGRAATLPPVPQPPRTPARRGSQPSAGVIVEPEPGSRELEVLAWNTSAPERTHNVSHAERQFVNWFEDRPRKWLERVQTVFIRVDGRPVCENCTADLERLRNAYSWINFSWTGAPASTAESLEVAS